MISIWPFEPNILDYPIHVSPALYIPPYDMGEYAGQGIHMGHMAT